MLGWIGTIFLLLAYVLVGQKNRTGFLMSVAGNILWAVVGFMTLQWDLLVCSILFTTLALNNWRLWKAPKEEPEVKGCQCCLCR